MQNKLAKTLEATYWSIVIDETTDKSTETKLAICVQYFDMAEFRLKLNMLDVIRPISTDSDGLVKTIMAVINKAGFDVQNIAGFCADTCNTMFGQKHSVTKLLKDMNPDLFTMRL